MIGRLVGAVLASEAANARRIMGGTALLLAAIGLLLIALGFGLLAVLWALMEFMRPWQAALCAGAIALLAAWILRLAGQSMIRSRRRREVPSQRETLELLLGEKGLLSRPLRSGDTLTLILIAAAAGIVAGRRFTK
jgi:hypothetical protein